MIRHVLIAVSALGFMAPAMAQQNQVPGDTNAGGNSQDVSGTTAAHAAQSGANTSDATTTGASGPSNKKSGKPGPIALPPLPSDKLCSSYQGEVQAECLSTTLNHTSGAAP